MHCSAWQGCACQVETCPFGLNILMLSVACSGHQDGSGFYLHGMSVDLELSATTFADLARSMGTVVALTASWGHEYDW
jgi:hypothetical protein